MNWKQWPYWVKGGIVGLLIAIVLYVLVIAITITDFAFCIIVSGPEHPVPVFCNVVTPLDNLAFTFGFGHPFVHVILILGSSIVGDFYGKIKNHREVI